MASVRSGAGDTAAHPPRVIAGLLRGQPELTVLAKAAGHLAQIETVDGRLALVSTVVSVRPSVLVLPPFDAERTSTAPLVRRVRREAPGVAVLVVACHPAGAGQPMLSAVQAGARVIALLAPRELEAILTELLRRGADGAPH